jgi:hypothetical protein
MLARYSGYSASVYRPCFLSLQICFVLPFFFRSQPTHLSRCGSLFVVSDLLTKMFSGFMWVLFKKNFSADFFSPPFGSPFPKSSTLCRGAGAAKLPTDCPRAALQNSSFTIQHSHFKSCRGPFGEGCPAGYP